MVSRLPGSDTPLPQPITMSGKKTTTTQNSTSTNTYGFYNRPETASFSALKNFDFGDRLLAPTIDANFAREGQEIDAGYDSPYTAIGNPVLKQRLRDKSKADLFGRKSLALEQADFDRKGLEFARLQALADYEAPIFAQTGGTQTGTAVQKQSGGWLGGLLGGAAKIGSAFI